jgi:HK97 gp10 family phage protein
MGDVVTFSVEGHKELAAKLRAMGGPRVRAIARAVATEAMAPVLGIAKSRAPIGPTGRLRASLGKLAKSNRRRDAFSSAVGTRRDFKYRSRDGVKTVSGRGKGRDAALKKGYTQDTKTAQQYARLIEFGQDKKGRWRRRAGPANFLESAIQDQKNQIIATVSSALRRHVEQPAKS